MDYRVHWAGFIWINDDEVDDYRQSHYTVPIVLIILLLLFDLLLSFAIIEPFVIGNSQLIIFYSDESARDKKKKKNILRWGWQRCWHHHPYYTCRRKHLCIKYTLNKVEDNILICSTYTQLLSIHIPIHLTNFGLFIKQQFCI